MGTVAKVRFEASRQGCPHIAHGFPRFFRWPVSRGVLDAAGELLDHVVHLSVLFDEFRHLVDRMQHGGVVSPAKALAYARQADVGEFPRQVHA